MGAAAPSTCRGTARVRVGMTAPAATGRSMPPGSPVSAVAESIQAVPWPRPRRGRPQPRGRLRARPRRARRRCASRARRPRRAPRPRRPRRARRRELASIGGGLARPSRHPGDGGARVRGRQSRAVMVVDARCGMDERDVVRRAYPRSGLVRVVGAAGAPATRCIRRSWRPPSTSRSRSSVAGADDRLGGLKVVSGLDKMLQAVFLLSAPRAGVAVHRRRGRRDR